MNSYTITISSDGGEAETTVAVDHSDGVPRVTEVAIKAAPGAGVSAKQLQAIDLDLLLRALSPAAGTQTPPAPAPERGANRPVQRAKPEPVVGKASTNGGRRKVKRRSTGSTADTGTTRTNVSSARAYRRMPDDLAEVYAGAGSVTAVAAHYGVPRHTAQGWLGRLRRQD